MNKNSKVYNCKYCGRECRGRGGYIVHQEACKRKFEQREKENKGKVTMIDMPVSSDKEKLKMVQDIRWDLWSTILDGPMRAKFRELASIHICPIKYLNQIKDEVVKEGEHIALINTKIAKLKEEYNFN